MEVFIGTAGCVVTQSDIVNMLEDVVEKQNWSFWSHISTPVTNAPQIKTPKIQTPGIRTPSLPD